mgnify:CR=1 FL=1
MDHIRLIASDMDATLLDERSQLPPDFAETIRALAGQGILFAAASGRPLYTLETMFPELLEEIVLIGDNGGAARWKGKDLFVSEMPAEGWRQLARSTKQAGDVGLLCGLQAAYAEKRDERYDAVFKNFYTRVEYVDDLTAVEAAADDVGEPVLRREGYRTASWVLLDYVDIVVHIQHAEEREFYALDTLWKDCPTMPFVDRDLADAEAQ